jgi:hypothetical protein
MSSTKGLRGAFAGLVFACLLVSPHPAVSEGQNKIVYDSFDWLIYRSTHFEIYHYDRGKDALPKVASMAESAYDELSRRLNYQIPKPIPLIYYTSHAEFEQNNIILNFIPEGVGAFAEAARNRMVLPIDLPDEKLQALIQHELTHIFQYEILFGGRLSRVLTANAPTWFMEGMASYYGKDEDDKDRMFIRDAVNSDQIPPITRINIQGYSAYRYGHAFFDFIENEWGEDAVREFIFEFRSFLGRDVSTAVKRTFEIEADEFDMRFRRYLRRKYLPLLATKGEASEYGQRFRVGAPERPSFEIGAAPSPSGDFIATITTNKDDVDIALLSTRSRRLFKNLTIGRTTKYEYLSAQYLTMGPESGQDIGFAPDGDRIAAFARRERGRQLFIISARSGKTVDRISVAPDMPLSPSFSRDGKTVFFSGIDKNSRDIFALDLASKKVRNLSNDPAFDTGPVMSRDGKFIYHAKVVSGLHKIVRFPIDDPSKVEQVTFGEGNDEDPNFSVDGSRLLFSSSRMGGIHNIFAQDLKTGEMYQYTDVIGAAIGPAALMGPDGQERIVFSGFQAQRFQLYMTEAKKPLKRLDEKAMEARPFKEGDVAGFVPTIEVNVDPAKSKPSPRFRFFLENVGVQAGINTDQTFVSQVRFDFSDYLGDKRAVFVFDSVSSFSNFHLGYYNMKKRLQWGVQLYDIRTYYLGIDEFGQTVQDRRIYKETGIRASGIYPVSRYTRFEGNIGYISRTLDVPYAESNVDGSQFVIFLPRTDNVPTGGVSFSYDASRYSYFGPSGGRRLDVRYQYTPDFTDGGTLTSDFWGESRVYLPISRRNLFAFRLFGGYSDGNAPTVYYFGGLDTLRGYDYRTLIGNRIVYLNAEFRFPLIDVIAMPFLTFQGIRGRIFLDVGGAWLKDQTFQFWDGDTNSLKDGRASYGAGFSIYFLGMPWNFDWARQWDFNQNLSGWRGQFYIGMTF